MITSISLETSILESSKQFALDRVGLSEDLYRQRGEARKSKMVEDIQVGTMAEWACYEYLRGTARNSTKITKPDTKIYTAKKKSFSPDIVYTLKSGETANFHIKSQTYKSAKAYGASWLFQKTDKLFADPAENDYAIFCLVEDDRVDIVACVQVKDLVQRDLLEEPKVWKYRGTKQAIYLDHVLEADIDTSCF